MLVSLTANGFIPSEWTGNYTCQNDIMRWFKINLTMDTASIKLLGDMDIDGTEILTEGTFASVFKIIAYQTNDFIVPLVFGRNFSKVEFNGRFTNPLLIDGFSVFTETNGKTTCPTQLKRGPGKFFIGGFNFYCNI